MEDHPDSRIKGYRFDDFVVDLQGKFLSRAGTAVHLEPKAFRLLVLLLERRGEVVARDELLERVWEETFVTENALTRSVARLRKALGDDPHEPRYVATAPTFGYRFVAAAQELADAAFPGAGEPAPARGPVRRPWRRFLGVAAGLLVLGLGIYALRDPVSRPAGEPVRRLAVLPLRNLGPPDQEYLAEGIHEALVSDLSKIPGLRVISRTSTQLYRDSPKPMPEIAGELGVGYLVEGAVLVERNRVRIIVQLIDGPHDEHLWSEGFERERESTLALVGEIAGTISGEIEIVLSPRTRELLKRGPVRLDVQEAYLKAARYQLDRFSPESARAASELYQEAIRLDPGFAPAHAELAFTLLFLGENEESRRTAERALHLDSHSEMAYVALGYLHLIGRHDWEAAHEALLRARDLNPSNALTRHLYADYLSLVGRLDEAVEEVREGALSDPKAPLLQRPVTYHLLLARRFGEAAAEARRLFAKGLGSDGIRDDLARALWHEGRYDEALKDFRALLGVGARNDVRGSNARREMRLLAAALAERPRSDPMDVASHYALAGEAEPTLEWLEKAITEGQSLTVLFLKTNPDFDFLRGDARFQALVRRLNLP